MSEYDERRLEELMRAGLSERAAQADTSVDLHPAARAGQPGRTGHPWRTPLLAAAAVAVALVVTVPLVTRDGGQPGPPPSTVPTATDDPTGADVPPGWRVESYGGIQVRVPDDWAVGGAPMAEGGSAGMVQCGGVVDEIANPVRGVPYVGRPVSMTDMCEAVDPTSLPAPTESYVWLGSPVEQTGAAWSNGYESETVEVAGVTVTVTTDDAAVREQIVDSIEAVDVDVHGCATSAPRHPSGEVVGDPTGLTVCVYHRDLDDLELLWSGRAAATAAAALLRALDRDAGASLTCRTTEPEWDTVVLHVASEATASYVVRPSCGVIEAPGGGLAPLTRATVRPWALTGVRAYVTAPPGSEDLVPYLRGIMG